MKISIDLGIHSDEFTGKMNFKVVRQVVRNGYDASRDISMLARKLDADLIVIGAVGRIGIKGLLMGNASDTKQQKVECSGLTVKPPGFESSVSA